MVSYVKKVGSLFIAIILFMCLTISVYGDTGSGVSVDSSITVESNSAEIANICNQANNSIGLVRDKVLNYKSSGSNGLLTFSNKNYSKLDSDEKETFMETALKATTKTGLNAKTKNKVYNFIASQDTPVTSAMKYLQSDANADFLEAKKWFDPFSGVVGTILGVLCVAVFMFTGVSIVFDICYLVLPGVQAVLERGEDNKKPFGVSVEAYTALRDAEKDTEYRNVVAIYLKRRVLLLIIMSVCIGYLISGQIYDIVAFFIDAFTL
jgi:hypothetical protein